MTAGPRADDKVVTAGVAHERANAWRAGGERVVVGVGVFDLLQASHARAVARARALGERLVVLLLDDRAAAERLGPGRPLVPASDRARVCAALRAVDLVAVVSPAEAPAWLAEFPSADVEYRSADDLVTRLRAGRTP